MKALLSIFRTSNHLVCLSTADLTDDLARKRTRGSEGPSITWTIGHLLDARYQVLAFLGDERPSPWAATFGDVPATDGAGYPALATLREEWKKTHAALEHAFASASPDALDRASAQPGPHGETTIRDDVAFLAWHEGYHIGVIGAARIAAGLAGPAELVRAAATGRPAPGETRQEALAAAR